MKKRNIVIIVTSLLVPAILLTIGLISVKDENPVTLTLWHNYGGQLKEKMDVMIEEFNGTIGAKEGVIISVTSISGSATLHEKLTMAANQDPGAPTLPDITTAYPKTALILEEKELLVDLENLFTEKELSAYIPRFIEEGRLSKEKLCVFPTAKSTEVLFINQTIFDRLAEATGASLEDLQTFEGIMKTAALYYEWTDNQTPEIKNDGKTFFVSDSLFNYTLIGCRQLKSDFMKDDAFHFSDPIVRKVWESYFNPATKGQYAIFDGYSADLAKTGDIVCSTGSTAGVSFYSPTVTYSDNTTEPAEMTILPYPVFVDGDKVAVQRGAGMCIIKSDKKKEKLAGLFLKWFTSPEVNLRFVSSTGYLPVTEAAYGDIMQEEINHISDPNVKKLLEVSRVMQTEYDYYISPLFDGIDELMDSYNTHLKTLADASKKTYLSLLDTQEAELAFNIIIESKYDEFTSYFK
ncbi:MAG: carbohydrate transporter substrate-binding protein family [Herbinix sp.]|jgi:multiple sugar transport system substrate-binding protein|nr:carbohydrate transporter substrate-binding protein family [Herbinix sp.]